MLVACPALRPGMNGHQLVSVVGSMFQFFVLLDLFAGAQTHFLPTFRWLGMVILGGFWSGPIMYAIGVYRVVSFRMDGWYGMMTVPGPLDLEQ